jgi:hypothetical protein
MDRLSSTILQPLFASKDALPIQHEDPSRRAQAEDKRPRYYSASNHTLCIHFPPAFAYGLSLYRLSIYRPSLYRLSLYWLCTTSRGIALRLTLLSALPGAQPYLELPRPRSLKLGALGACQMAQPIVAPMIPRYFRIEHYAQVLNLTLQKEPH